MRIQNNQLSNGHYFYHRDFKVKPISQNSINESKFIDVSPKTIIIAFLVFVVFGFIVSN